MNRLSCALFLIGTLMALPAAADDQSDAADAEAARVCDAYGPGYRPIPGTTVCVKTGGDVRFGASVGSGSQPKPDK
jgi:hypothetical protein